MPVSPTAIPAKAPIAVLCLSASWGGMEINTAKLAGWLYERDWPVQLIAKVGSPLAEQAERQRLPIAFFTNPWRALDVPAAWRLHQLLRRHGTRVLIVTRNQDLAVAVLCKRWFARHLRIVYQQHMQIGRRKRDPLHTWRYRALDAWLAPLPGLAEQVAEYTRMDMRRVYVVPLGVELSCFLKPGLTPQQARQQLRLPLSGQLLGLLGRFDEGKGQYAVVEAYHRLRQQYPEQQNVHLVLVGEPTRNHQKALRYHAAVLRRIEELGLSAYVHVRGFTKQPEAVYRALDVALVASANETYGMVTIEAMAAGLPIVATQTGGTREILVDGETGLLYPPGNTAAWVAAAGWCLQHPAAAQAMGARARQEAVCTYSHQRQCELTEAILRQLL